ncbi:hypothetical protein [Flavobacterium sp. ACAM 123]|jgi:hypothetical protein|uniref:hypothetical protein n=1 Tax=Flavobacterium sp. ACAM 123 TaxID=1189620 RepID=UPI00036D29E6|nr:hypothetical protein [Flavobacterium sp. ACAM 123]
MKYSNAGVRNEVSDSFSVIKNRIRCNHDDYSNKVRVMVPTFENKKQGKADWFYSKKASFINSNTARDEICLVLDQMKELD